MLYQIVLEFQPFIIFIPKKRNHDLPKSKEIFFSWLIFKLKIIIKK